MPLLDNRPAIARLVSKRSGRLNRPRSVQSECAAGGRYGALKPVLCVLAIALVGAGPDSTTVGFPEAKRSTLEDITSTPITVCPSLAKHPDVTQPTYPKPKTLISTISPPKEKDTA